MRLQLCSSFCGGRGRGSVDGVQVERGKVNQTKTQEKECNTSVDPVGRRRKARGRLSSPSLSFWISKWPCSYTLISICLSQTKNLEFTLSHLSLLSCTGYFQFFPLGLEQVRDSPYNPMGKCSWNQAEQDSGS